MHEASDTETHNFPVCSLYYIYTFIQRDLQMKLLEEITVHISYKLLVQRGSDIFAEDHND